MTALTKSLYAVFCEDYAPWNCDLLRTADAYRSATRDGNTARQSMLRSDLLQIAAGMADLDRIWSQFGPGFQCNSGCCKICAFVAQSSILSRSVFLPECTDAMALEMLEGLYQIALEMQ